MAKVYMQIRNLLLLFAFILTTNPMKAQDNNAPDLIVGAAKVKMTPSVGSIMGDSYGIRISTGVHDDLHIKTLVFQKAGVKVAFITLEVISLPHELVMKSRQLIHQQTGITADNIIMNATHAHAGPQLNPLMWEAVGGDAKQKSIEYTRNLPVLVLESVRLAISKLQPAKISVTKVQENTVNFNRRFLMKDGTFRTNPGKLNPNTVRPAGPIDPDLSVIYFESLDKKPLAILVNFALHVAVVGGTQFSADFPGVMSDLIGQIKGEEVVTIFTNGTSGNINHFDVSNPNQLGGLLEARRIGTVLAGRVLASLSSLRPVVVNSLQAKIHSVKIPVLRSVDAQELIWAKDIMARYGLAKGPAFSDVVTAWKLLDIAKIPGGIEARHKLTTTVPLTPDGSFLESEVSAIALGDQIALVGFPGDAFVELGLSIKLNSPYPFTVVSEQSGNGTISYMPNRKAFPEGSYEVESARYSSGGGETLADAAVRTVIELFYKK
ncbi:MAG: neutral/alkaline non-lysosomal ceramidase N-terminal domain-containing protein [Daejeonella sp.]|uniref:neutral/alkaline non-lysosomal ceramidase N-terminal domain-containing protein n=1 Tax=Daejeonella sp. TaxID=2805397 RepID=UPI003C794EC8